MARTLLEAKKSLAPDWSNQSHQIFKLKSHCVCYTIKKSKSLLPIGQLKISQSNAECSKPIRKLVILIQFRAFSKKNQNIGKFDFQ